jgi:hypothetical protein
VYGASPQGRGEPSGISVGGGWGHAAGQRRAQRRLWGNLGGASPAATPAYNPARRQQMRRRQPPADNRAVVGCGGRAPAAGASRRYRLQSRRRPRASSHGRLRWPPLGFIRVGEKMRTAVRGWGRESTKYCSDFCHFYLYIHAYKCTYDSIIGVYDMVLTIMA